MFKPRLFLLALFGFFVGLFPGIYLAAQIDPQALSSLAMIIPVSSGLLLGALFAFLFRKTTWVSQKSYLVMSPYTIWSLEPRFIQNHPIIVWIVRYIALTVLVFLSLFTREASAIFLSASALLLLVSLHMISIRHSPLGNPYALGGDTWASAFFVWGWAGVSFFLAWLLT
jgi:hypothetical protein